MDDPVDLVGSDSDGYGIGGLVKNLATQLTSHPQTFNLLIVQLNGKPNDFNRSFIFWSIKSWSCLSNIGVSFQLHLRDRVALDVVGIVRSRDSIRHNSLLAQFGGAQFPGEPITG